MSSAPLSLSRVRSLLADILEEVMMSEEEESVSSLELGCSSSIEHPLPCSADFEFFFAIATTAPPHTPDSTSFTCSGVTPPPSPSPPPSTATPGRSPASPSSPGVSLLPLSGQITQAVLTFPVDTSIHDHDACHEEFASSKKIKLEVVDQTDCLEDTVEISDVIHLNEGNENEITDDEIPCLPLTFTTRADLLWKLQKAEIIPASSDLPSQRPHGRGWEGVTNHEKEKDTSSCREVIKDTVITPHMGVEIVANIKKERAGEIISLETDEDRLEEEEDSNLRPALNKDEDEKGVHMENSHQSGPQRSMASLLHKPPRLGLSKLYRSSTSLHDISIIEKVGKRATFQSELSIIEKEE